jgi:hypothetical protein
MRFTSNLLATSVRGWHPDQYARFEVRDFGGGLSAATALREHASRPRRHAADCDVDNNVQLQPDETLAANGLGRVEAPERPR